MNSEMGHPFPSLFPSLSHLFPPSWYPVPICAIMPTASKKVTTKTTTKANGAATKPHTAAHPTWVDMIKECIIAHPEDARAGVSRPMIKKFVESKYHIDLTATAASQLNRAITSGNEKGIFQLPKGPSGKVKLAPEARPDAAKENAKPPAKKSSAKPAATKAKPAAPSTKKSTPTKPKVAAVKASVPTKKYTAVAKKAPVKKATSTTKKTAIAKKATTTTKKVVTKPGAAKKAITGETKKPEAKGVKAKSGPKAKPTSKAKPASKSKAAKPASKTKPSSKT